MYKADLYALLLVGVVAARHSCELSLRARWTQLALGFTWSFVSVLRGPGEDREGKNISPEHDRDGYRR